MLFDGGEVTVEDLSGKGTVVSGAKTSRAPLPDGADIALGHWRAVFHGRGPGEDAAPTVASGAPTEVQRREEPQRWSPAQVRVRTAAGETVHRMMGVLGRVGSDAGNDLVLTNRFISGRHLRVSRREGGFLAVDPGSTNGVFLGNVRIYEAVLPMHTTLRCGETELTLEPVTPARKETAFQGIIGADPGIRQLAELIERVAPSSATVAILGESGIGEGAGGTRHPCPELPRGSALHPGELRGDRRGADRERAVRPREGVVHRGGGAHKGAFEEADGGHALPRRDRRAAARAAGQAAARAGVGGDPPRRSGAGRRWWTCGWWRRRTGIS